MTVELLLPTSRKIAYGTHRLQRKIKNAAFFTDPREISHVFGGRAAMPNQPIILMGADGHTPIIVVTAGVSEAAEIEEIAIAAKEKGAAKLKATGSQLDTKSFRERNNLPQIEEFDTRVKEHLFNIAKQQRKLGMRPHSYDGRYD